MIGKCQSCGTSNVEVTPSKENGKKNYYAINAGLQMERMVID